MESNNLRVRLSYRLPVDPLAIRSMADYDLALLLTDTWFSYDDSRKAKANLIKSWTFNSEQGVYTFKINSDKKWSNGKKLRAEELIWNLQRAIKLKTQYGNAIESLINVSSITSPDDLTILIQTKDKKPSESFFQRMGGQPLAIIHPSDADKDSLKIVSNKTVIGPYVVSKIESNEIVLIKNKYYLNENKHSPVVINIRQSEPIFNLNDFLSGKSWEHITQVNSFILPETEKLLKEKHLPLWTRGHDRVSLLKPLNKNRIDSLKSLLIILGQKLESINFDHLPMNVKRATSLQPVGYPLYDKLKNKKNVVLNFPKEIKILAPTGQSTESQIKILKPIFNSMGINAYFDLHVKSEFANLLYSSQEYDFALFDFGVADPEPSTWIGIITTNEFIHLDPDDNQKFQQASQFLKIEDEIKAFKELLESSFMKGNYLPLFHFSTLSIGQSNINFSLIKELDETVDYSKLIIK